MFRSQHHSGNTLRVLFFSLARLILYLKRRTLLRPTLPAIIEPRGRKGDMPPPRTCCRARLILAIGDAMPIRIPTRRPASLRKREGPRRDIRLRITRPDPDLARTALLTRGECPLFGGSAGVPAAPARHGASPCRIRRTEVPELDDHRTRRGILPTRMEGARIRRVLGRVIVGRPPGARWLIIGNRPIIGGPRRGAGTREYPDHDDDYPSHLSSRLLAGRVAFNNSRRSSHSSPDYTLSDHRASWLTDPRARPQTAHPPSSLHSPRPW